MSKFKKFLCCAMLLVSCGVYGDALEGRSHPFQVDFPPHIAGVDFPVGYHQDNALTSWAIDDETGAGYSARVFFNDLNTVIEWYEGRTWEVHESSEFLFNGQYPAYVIKYSVNLGTKVCTSGNS